MNQDTNNNNAKMNNPPQLCRHYMSGKCRHGGECRYKHDPTLCRKYYQGRCNRTQEECKYSHDFSPPPKQQQQHNQRHPPNFRTHAGISQKRIINNPEQPDEHNSNEFQTTLNTTPTTPSYKNPTKNTKVAKHQSNNPKNKNKYNRKRKPKNTESFDPDLSPPDMRLMIEYENKETYPNKIQENDVIILPNFFQDPSIYNELLREMKETEFNQDKLWKLWHGDSHLIADDKLGNWKAQCPTFIKVINKMKDYFNVDVKATRFNWYKDNKDWKPYHRDAAAIDPRKAKTQNITIGMTFGATRTASFQHLHTKSRIDIPLSDGSVYIFCKQVNIDWMHGIVQEPELKKDGRISIIIWGNCNDMEPSN